ncbi:hypothetical protein D3C72_2531910 [compost metagenome]
MGTAAPTSILPANWLSAWKSPVMLARTGRSTLARAFFMVSVPFCCMVQFQSHHFTSPGI